MAQTTLNNGDAGSTVRTELNTMFSDLYADTRGAVAYKSFYIDGNRTDSYTADGTIMRPFKTVSACVASGLITAASVVYLAPATYTEASSVTLPNYPLVVFGNGSTLSITGTATIPNPQFSHYDLNTVTSGGITFSSSSAGRVLIQGGSISGNLTLNGLTDIKSCSLLSGTITANSTAQFLAIVSTFTSQVTGAGKIILENCIFNTSKSSALVTSTSGGELIFVNNLLTNLGTGGGISCANGATTAANMISNNVLTVASGAPVACGTAVTIYSNNVLAGGTNTGTGYIAVNSDYSPAFTTTPASKTAAGFPGQYASDGTYWYLCTAVNTWIRGSLAMASW
jgi:hypothetical protein